MSDSPEAKIRIGGDDAPLRQTLRSMKDGLASWGADAKRTVEGAQAPLDTLRSKFLAFSAVLAGGTLFGRAIEQTAQYSEASIQLSKAMGQGAGGASIWISTLADVGSSTDELATASRGLLKGVRDNEEGLNKMGLATRDSAGNLRPMNDLLLDAIELTNGYAEGTDRQVAAQQIWGKGVNASSAFLKINAEAVRENQDAMRDLGLVMTREMVQAYEEHDGAMDRAELTFKGLVNAIGGAVMPVLTRLAQWFNTIGPGAVVVIRGAIGGLVSVFWGLKNSVVMAFEVINATVITAAEPVRALASAFYKLMQGDFAGAREELMNWPARISGAWATAWSNIVASSRDAREKIGNLFLPGSEATDVPSGGRRATVEPKGNKDKDPSAMPRYEAALAEEKRVQAILTAGREFTKEQELAYWRWLLDKGQVNAQDRLTITRKTAGLEVEILRAAAAQGQSMRSQEAEAATSLALAKLEAEQAAAEAAHQLGQISAAQLAALHVGFEQQRYEIAAAALRQRLELLQLDPDANPVEKARLLNEVLVLEQQHKARLLGLQAKATTEGSSARGIIADTFGSEATWQNLFNGILQNARNWRQALGGIVTGAGQSIINELVIKPMAAWVAGLARMLLVKMGFLQADKAASVAGSSATLAIKGAEATGVVAANAAEAGSGAAASVSSIPFVGPALALAALAAVFSAVSGLGKGIKSAAGGYDIPSGVNPITQLHEDEMVLPSPLADAVRRMASDGGAATGWGDGGAPVLQSTPMPGGFWLTQEREFVRFFKRLERKGAL